MEEIKELLSQLFFYFYFSFFIYNVLYICIGGGDQGVVVAAVPGISAKLN